MPANALSPRCHDSGVAAQNGNEPRGARSGPRAGKGEGVPSGLDSIDRQIVALLLKDGRMSSAAMARAIGVSQRSVRYHLDRLTGSGVIQVGAVVNPQAIGLNVVGDVFLEVSPGQIREVAERFAALEEVSYVAGSIGNGDLSIQLCVRDAAELTRFVDDVVAMMPGVTKTRTVLVPWKLKDVYEWNIPPSFGEEDG
jgi:Lrp/AsnC family transcriptional regulator, regulator for asnA, asnC and gidA